MGQVDIGGAIVDEGQGVRTWLEIPTVTAAGSGEVAGCPVRVGESQTADQAADRAADQAVQRMEAIQRSEKEEEVQRKTLVQRSIPGEEDDKGAAVI